MNIAALGLALALFDPYWPCPPEAVCVHNQMAASHVVAEAFQRWKTVLNVKGSLGATADENMAPRLAVAIAHAQAELDAANELYYFWAWCAWIRYGPALPEIRTARYLQARAYLGDALWFSGQWWRP